MLYFWKVYDFLDVLEGSLTHLKLKRKGNAQYLFQTLLCVRDGKKHTKYHWLNFMSEKLAHKICAKTLKIGQKLTKMAHKIQQQKIKAVVKKLAQLWNISKTVKIVEFFCGSLMDHIDYS